MLIYVCCLSVVLCHRQDFVSLYFFVSVFVFLLSRSARKHRLGEGRGFYFAISWRWTLPMCSSSHTDMQGFMPLQDVVFGGL